MSAGAVSSMRKLPPFLMVELVVVAIEYLVKSREQPFGALLYINESRPSSKATFGPADGGGRP
jgi:hypothetical protein